MSRRPSNKVRNLAIINALDDGYTQSQISNYLRLSKSLISKVVKSGNSTPIVL
jgi:transposase